jgi:hypothetical protein
VGDERAAVVVMDVWGLMPAVSQAIRESIARVIRTDARRVWVSTSGNATSPRLWANDEEYTRYVAYLPELCGGSAVSALHDLQPAAIGGASATVTGVSTNVAGPGHDADQAVAAISVTGENNRSIARIFSFACPASVAGSDGHWTADWPGYAVWALEQSTGGIALFVRGSDAGIRPFDWWDGNPSPTHKDRSPSDVQSLGLLVATQAAQAAARAQLRRNVAIGAGADPDAGLYALRIGDAVFISADSPQPSVLTARLRGTLARSTVIMSANLRGDPFHQSPALDPGFMDLAASIARSAGAG